MPLSVAYIIGLPVLTPSDVLIRLNHVDFFVFDNNPEQVFLHNHLPGARHLDPIRFTEYDLPTDRGASLLFYSSGPLCGAGTHAARRARKMGYPHVYVMIAGITGWIREGCPVEKG
jgi:rhodanese-related sulfurtransferase